MITYFLTLDVKEMLMHDLFRVLEQFERSLLRLVMFDTVAVTSAGHCGEGRRVQP